MSDKSSEAGVRPDATSITVDDDALDYHETPLKKEARPEEKVLILSCPDPLYCDCPHNPDGL